MSPEFMSNCWAFSSALTFVSGILNTLAVIGAAVVGGLLTGYIVRMFILFLTGKHPLPRTHLLARLFGALLFGFLTAYFFSFGGKGPGEGGGGGTGKDKGNDVTPGQKDKPPVKDQTPPNSSESQLEIEILGNLPLGTEEIYYLRNDQKLLSLEDLKKAIRAHRATDPKRGVTLILYRDSPAQDKRQVTLLREWLSEALKSSPETRILGGMDAPQRSTSKSGT